MNCMDSMTIKNYNKFDGYNFFALFSISLFLILSLFSLTMSNVIANLGSNSTLTNSNSTLTNSNSTLTNSNSTLTNSNSTLTNSNSTLTNSNSTEINLNGTITSFPGSIDSDRRHMPVL